ncbi:hypothetical protein ACOTTU_17855 [Roseobacter sp. EG26]|uniref:hypothetical protein n=1 Tax=Roseobacter sp. EG26 TaxID=3412477 RepID=UPI003CE56441
MSPEPRHLRDWIAALFAGLDRAEPHSASGVRKLAGSEASRIALDEERVTVRFDENGLRVSRLKTGARLTPPYGVTDRKTVGALLLGYMEISEAIAHNHIRLRGTADQVMAICAIIEVLVDASTRIPALQELADDFLASTELTDLRAEQAQRHRQSDVLRLKELALLQREGLLNGT